jgi:ABC-2 type transport system permease protein
MRLVRLLIRRHRVLIAVWLLLLVALSGVTVSAYQSTYPTPRQRAAAVELAQHNASTLLMYGHLPAPGTPAQMFAWEIGAFATILAGVLGVLLAVALTRAAEDDGTLELVRSVGIAPGTATRAGLAVLGLVAVLLGLGCAGAVGAYTGRIDGVGWPGAFAYGAAVGLTFVLTATLATVLAQVASSSAGARAYGFAVLGLAFVLRVVADSRDVGWLNWLSPLGLRATIRPFAGDHWPAMVGYLAVAVGLAWLTTALSARREYRTGLLPAREPRARRLRVRTGFGFAARLARRSLLGWTAAVAGLGGVFVTMGAGAVRQSRDGHLGGFLGAQLGTADPVAGFLSYAGTAVALVVSVYAILAVLRARTDEAGGLTDLVLATGQRRFVPLLAQFAVAATGSAVILAVTGVAGALVAPAALDGTDVASRTLGYLLGQWPGVVLLAGLAALLAGAWPRWSGLAWVPLVVSGGLALLGRLFGVPAGVLDFGVFQHVPDVAAAHPDARGLLLMLAVAAVAVAGGLAAIRRRDLVTG